MNKLFPIVLALMYFGFLLSIEAITEYHLNGMPKVIKTYKGSNKLELTKEIGYYSDGTKEYQKNYYNGEFKDIQKQNRDGSKISKEDYKYLYLYVFYNKKLDRLESVKSNVNPKEYVKSEKVSLYLPIDVHYQYPDDRNTLKFIA